MSEATEAARTFIAAHARSATALGEELAELTEEPDAFVVALVRGLAALVDPAYTDLAERVSPGVPADLQVRGPLVDAVQKPLRRALREGSSTSALRLAERLLADERRSVRMFALPALARSLPEDPELCWQSLRRMGRGAADWIEVDSLADLWARGILAERFRWSELEQLIYSRHVYERRLVGATLATIPHRVPSEHRDELGRVDGDRTIELLRQLMGDAEVMVQKALSWAIREWTRVAPTTIAAFLRAETTRATETRDGARAWVIRDSLSSQPADLAAALRAKLRGIRRDPAAASTSIAALRAADFAAVLTEADDTVAAQGHRYTRSHA